MVEYMTKQEWLEEMAIPELLEELLKRTTFAGVVIWYTKECKAVIGEKITEERAGDLHVCWRNMSDESAVLNLHKAINVIAKGEDISRPQGFE